ncbi:LOW QUALITY PROTEIN: hypothetical protein PHMEG_00034835 [Phytophthora megakarya]|uniref:Chromo domain-containing protein n=1 Tax=Phytophthora megakarya TaxID=4795 RepID=A0A225UQI4_9STRA|nr:LOW QUALITY PROTEIN: hypothetical protein PHMEG_00034835 [Phytophthora megakarya]
MRTAIAISIGFLCGFEQSKIGTLPEQPGDIQHWLSATRTSIRAMHKPVITARIEQTKRNQRRRSPATQPNFDVGDYIKGGPQTPIQVTGYMDRPLTNHNTHSFKVRYLVTGEETDVHASRLKFYADSSLQITEEIREHVAAQGQILAVEELLDYTWNAQKKDYDILVSWKGLEAIEDSIEAAKSLAKDIPVLLNQFAAARDDSRFEEHVIALTQRHCVVE